jgi:hypothetical protein
MKRGLSTRLRNPSRPSCPSRHPIGLGGGEFAAVFVPLDLCRWQRREILIGGCNIDQNAAALTVRPSNDLAVTGNRTLGERHQLGIGDGGSGATGVAHLDRISTSKGELTGFGGGVSGFAEPNGVKWPEPHPALVAIDGEAEKPRLVEMAVVAGDDLEVEPSTIRMQSHLRMFDLRG